MTERVLVAGYYGSGNTGDEAILTALLRDLRALRPTLEFTVVSANPPDTSARHGVRSLHERDIPALIDAAVESDLVLVGGGGVFHDYWGCDEGAVLSRRHAGIPFYAGFPLLAACAGRPSMVYATGVGPLSPTRAVASHVARSSTRPWRPCAMPHPATCSRGSASPA